jgi:enamine deaminase RidA (YjgF/YER057c/UK114 family)
MPLTRIDPGPRMSKVVVNGNNVHLSGLVAAKPEGASVAAQTRDILEQIDGYLAKAGTDKTKIVKAMIWLTDMDTWAEMKTAWDAWVDPDHAPVRAAVESPKLAAPQFTVEIMVDAVIE